MTDPLDLVRQANPVPRPSALDAEVRQRVMAAILAQAPVEVRHRHRGSRVRWRSGRGRLFVIVGSALLIAGGTAAALGVLNGQPSGPPSGKLSSPAADAGAAATGYTVSVTPNLQGGGVGWCVATRVYYEEGSTGGLGCGYAPLPHRPIVALGGGVSGSRDGNIYTSTPSLVFVTTAQVAAVRLSPTLTILTRPDPQLPDHYRVAIDFHQTISHKPINPALGQPAAAVALNHAGQQIGRPAAASGQPRDTAIFWPRAQVRKPPAGACEIDTGALRGASGWVVQQVRGFPQLTGKTYLSCASTQLADSHDRGTVAAILLDAQHPGSRPTPLPDAAPVPGHPQTFNEPAVQPPASTHSLRISNVSITGRRIGDTWLVVQSGGTLAQRLAVLDSLGVCVRLTGRPCQPPR
jgi:hypothetical protein